MSRFRRDPDPCLPVTGDDDWSPCPMCSTVPRGGQCVGCGSDWDFDDDAPTVTLVVERQSEEPLPERYLNTDQAARYLNVTPRYIKRLREDRRIQVTKVGKYNRYTREALDAATSTDPPPPDDAVGQASISSDDAILAAVTASRTRSIGPPWQVVA